MASVQLAGGTDMTTFRGYAGSITERAPTRITAQQGDIKITVSGAFAFDGDRVTGTVTDIVAERGFDRLAAVLYFQSPASQFISQGRVDMSAAFTPEFLSGDDGIFSIPGGSVLLGYAGNDGFGYTPGNDVIDGGAGFDNILLPISAAEYKVTASGNSYIVKSLTDRLGGGTDIISNIEVIYFSDGKLALGQNTRIADIYRLYEAAFDRTPDLPGLSFWAGQSEQRWSIDRFAETFIVSGEFQSKYGAGQTNRQFVDQLYQNVLDRPAEAAGIAFWVERLDNGASRASVLSNFADSIENRANVAPEIANGILYTDVYTFIF